MAIAKTDEGLKRVVGVQGLALSMVSITIGAGIFVLPAIVGMAMGVFGLLGYLFCSIMMAAIMLCYAEIGSRVTSSGGTYAYVEAAFGKFPGFIINWLYIFGYGVLARAIIHIGRVPMFFYIMHLYLIHGLALFAAEFSGYSWTDIILQRRTWIDPQLKGYGFSLGTTYLVWVGIILLLYPLCKWYDKYKTNHKEIWWLSYL